MRDINRIDKFTDELNRIWKTYFPDWRFMQLICNLQRYVGCDLFYIEEKEIVKLLQKYCGEKE